MVALFVAVPQTLSDGAMAAISIASVCAAGAAMAGGLILVKKRKRKATNEELLRRLEANKKLKADVGMYRTAISPFISCVAKWACERVVARLVQ